MNVSSEQIRILLIEKLAGVISAEDEVLIDALIAKDPAVMRVWRDMQLAVKEKNFKPRSDENAAWQEFARSVEEKAPRKYIGWKTMVAAAVVTMIIFMQFYGLPKYRAPSRPSEQKFANIDSVFLRNESGDFIYLDVGQKQAKSFDGLVLAFNDRKLAYTTSDSSLTAWQTLSVPRVLDYQIRLSDGSEVHLNSQSRLRFPVNFTGDTREVYLQGEAYFKVAKNASKPFIVHARGTDIRVLGTEFNLSAYDSTSVETSLVEGSVRSSGRDRQVELKPGLQAALTNGEFKVQRFDQSEVLSWMKGIHYFRSASLIELSKLLERWYRVTVSFENPLLETKEFSGEISKNQPVEVFLENLQLSTNIRASLTNGRIVLK